MKKILFVAFILCVFLSCESVLALTKSELKIKKYYSKTYSVKFEKANKSIIKVILKNKTKKRQFACPGYKLYLLKNKKWRKIGIYSPKTIEFKACEKIVIRDSWDNMLVDKKYLNKKGCLKKGKYKINVFYKKYSFKI